MEEPHNKFTKKSKNVDTLAAALGLKGPLRIVPQGVTRKPHIILKRVDDDDEPAASGSSKRVARFAFTTAKRIQLKPDADLIFALQAPDGEGLLLEGDLDYGTDSEADEPSALPAPVPLKPVEATIDQTKIGRLPPKMRKCMQRTSAFSDYFHYGPEKNFGFPGYPMSVEPPRVYSDATVQTEVPSLPSPSTSRALPLPVSTQPRQILPSDDNITSKSPLQLPSPVSADHARDHPIIDDVPVGAEHEDVGDASSQRIERSLSPMDFSSAESSPRYSPPLELPEEIVPLLPSLPSQTEPSPNTAPIDNHSLLFSAPKYSEMLNVTQEVEVPPVVNAADPPVVSEPEPSRIASNERATLPIPSGLEASAPSRLDHETTEAPQALPTRQAIVTTERHPTDNLGKPPPLGPRAMMEHLFSMATAFTAATTPRLPEPTAEINGSSSPAPDPRSVAYVPHGTTVNPLGIRPSQGLKPPTGPRALVANTSSAGSGLSIPKKPVVVGSGWSAARNPLASSSSLPSLSRAGAASSGGQTPSSSSSYSPAPATNLQRHSTKSGLNGGSEGSRTNLSQMLSYSPSPEPQDTSQRSTGWSGWKPLSPRGVSTEPIMNETMKREGSPSLKRIRDDVSSRASPSTNVSDFNVSEDAYSMKRARLEDWELSESVPHKTTHRRNPSAQVVLPRPPQSTAHIPPLPSTGKVKTLPPQLIHPLPAKPLLAINGGTVVAGSSYRPSRHSRDRDRDERDDFSSSSRRKRVRNREHDEYDERDERDCDRSASAGPSGSTSRGGTGPSTTARVRKSSGPSGSISGAQWPATTTSTISMLEGQGDEDLSVSQISVCGDGSHVALICADRSVRVWSTKQPATEVARLYNSSMPTCIIWDDRSYEIVTLCKDGSVGAWVKMNAGFREWMFVKWFSVLENEEVNPNTTLVMAYLKDRLAVSTPSVVKVWIAVGGQWKSQRDIVRSGVTALRFIRDGEVLMGGCKDGVLWCCEVPNGTLRVHIFFRKSNAITSIEAHPSGSNLLVTQEGGQSHLITFRVTENKGSIEKTYSCIDSESRDLALNPTALETQLSGIFATRGQAVLFGVLNSCTLIWDRKKGVIVYGLKHEEDDPILAAATFDGRPSSNIEGWMITGTKHGLLYWWPQPVAAASKTA